MTALASLTRSDLICGSVLFTVRLPENFVVARRMLGEDTWRTEYHYKLERVANRTGFDLYLRSLTERKGKEPSYVYTGAVDSRTGVLSTTRASAFPTHATRFRVADKTLRAIFTGRYAEMLAAGWTVELEVLDDSERF